MTGLDAPRWAEMFAPDLALAESFLRASAVYFAVLVLFRVVLKRQSGGLGVPDVMLIVLVSEAVSPALSADSKSVPNAIIAAAALLFWTYTLDRLERHWPWLQRRLEPPPVKLIADGEFLRENMSREGVTESELYSQIRQNGIEDAKRVKAAFIEPDGSVSVIPSDDQEPEPGVASEAVVPADLADAMRQFETAARVLEAAAAEHDRKCAEHRDAAKAVRRSLARHRRPGRAKPDTGR